MPDRDTLEGAHVDAGRSWPRDLAPEDLVEVYLATLAAWAAEHTDETDHRLEVLEEELDARDLWALVPAERLRTVDPELADHLYGKE